MRRAGGKIINIGSMMSSSAARAHAASKAAS
jgi:short-subunit dehydrogenase